MTTITMTFRQLKRVCSHLWMHCGKGNPVCGFEDQKHGCSKFVCPIWKRAEAKEKRKAKCSAHNHAAMKRDGWKNCWHCGVELFQEKPTVMGRSGTPLVKDDKIVRLPKKQWCGNCGDLLCTSWGRYNNTPCEDWKPRRKG